MSTAASVFQRELHFTSVQVRFVFSAFAYPYLIFQFIRGWLSDRLGARLTLTVSALIWSLATLLTGLATGLTSMLCARVLLGFGEGAAFPVATRECRTGPWWEARILSGNHPFRDAIRERFEVNRAVYIQ